VSKRERFKPSTPFEEARIMNVVDTIIDGSAKLHFPVVITMHYSIQHPSPKRTPHVLRVQSNQYRISLSSPSQTGKVPAVAARKMGSRKPRENHSDLFSVDHITWGLWVKA
jgi:hypothetical protein